jgi:hypothetical protein
MPDITDRPNPTWKKRPGGIKHAFAKVDVDIAPALCGSPFLIAALVDPTDDDLPCLPCAMKHGSDLADLIDGGVSDEGDTNPGLTGGNPWDL